MKKQINFITITMVTFAIILAYSCSQGSTEEMISEPMNAIENEMTISLKDGEVKMKLQVIKKDGDYLIKYLGESGSYVYSKEFIPKSENKSNDVYIIVDDKGYFIISRKQNIENLRVTDAGAICIDNNVYSGWDVSECASSLMRGSNGIELHTDNAIYGFKSASLIIGEDVSSEEAECLVDRDPTEAIYYCH